MDTSQPTNSNAAPQSAPEASRHNVGLPGSVLPADYTPEMADARIQELKADKDWSKKYLAGDQRAKNEFDKLSLRAKNLPDAEPKKEPTPTEAALAALGPPPTPADYKIEDRHGLPIKLDEENHAIIHGTLLPAAHALGLSQADVTIIGEYVTKPVDETRCEAILRRVWGKDFDQGIADFVAVRDANPQLRALLDQYLTLSNNPALIQSIVFAYRRAQGRNPGLRK